MGEVQNPFIAAKRQGLATDAVELQAQLITFCR